MNKGPESRVAKKRLPTDRPESTRFQLAEAPCTDLSASHGRARFDSMEWWTREQFPGLDKVHYSFILVDGERLPYNASIGLFPPQMLLPGDVGESISTNEARLGQKVILERKKGTQVDAWHRDEARQASLAKPDTWRQCYFVERTTRLTLSSRVNDRGSDRNLPFRVSRSSNVSRIRLVIHPVTLGVEPETQKG